MTRHGSARSNSKRIKWLQGNSQWRGRKIQTSDSWYKSMLRFESGTHCVTSSAALSPLPSICCKNKEAFFRSFTLIASTRISEDAIIQSAYTLNETPPDRAIPLNLMFIRLMIHSCVKLSHSVTAKRSIWIDQFFIVHVIAAMLCIDPFKWSVNHSRISFLLLSNQGYIVHRCINSNYAIKATNWEARGRRDRWSILR